MKTYTFHKDGDVFTFRYYSYGGEFYACETVAKQNLSRHLDAVHATGYVLRIL